MIVLDTHVWVWWMSGDKQLSRKAQDLLHAAQSHENIFVSSISVWELAQLSIRGRLQLTMDYRDWVTQAESLPFVHFVPVDNPIALKSVQLPSPLHQDPADRIIIATALILGATLLTKDSKIRQYPHVPTVW